MRFMASRMAARSTTAGTPGEVLQQHARRHEGDLDRRASALGSQRASARMSASLTVRPSSVRSRFSSNTRSE